MARLNILLSKYYRTEVKSELGRQQTSGYKTTVECNVHAPYNKRHSGMKNKERDVIGRAGCVITVQVKRSYTNASCLDEMVYERKETPLFTAQVTDFKTEYGCQWPPLMQVEGFKV